MNVQLTVDETGVGGGAEGVGDGVGGSNVLGECAIKLVEREAVMDAEIVDAGDLVNVNDKVLVSLLDTNIDGVHDTVRDAVCVKDCVDVGDGDLVNVVDEVLEGVRVLLLDEALEGVRVPLLDGVLGKERVPLLDGVLGGERVPLLDADSAVPIAYIVFAFVTMYSKPFGPIAI